MLRLGLGLGYGFNARIRVMFPPVLSVRFRVKIRSVDIKSCRFKLCSG